MNDDYIEGWAQELADNDFDDDYGDGLTQSREQKIEMYKTSIRRHIAAGDFDDIDDVNS